MSKSNIPSEMSMAVIALTLEARGMANVPAAQPTSSTVQSGEGRRMVMTSVA